MSRQASEPQAPVGQGICVSEAPHQNLQHHFDPRLLLRSAPHLYAHLASDGTWQPFDYQVWLGGMIARSVFHGGGRLVVNAPPRHGKSELVSMWTPAWLLDNWPGRRVIIAAYGADLAAGKFGRELREHFRLNPHRRITLHRDHGSPSLWHTPQGGGMLAVGVGGPITGFGADLLIIDDPVKNWEQASSPTSRRKLIEWFNSTFYTRAEPGASILVAMTRWHEDDLSGYLVREHGDPWRLLRLPALAEGDDPLGRAAGAPLCPARYDADALEAIRRATGPGGAWEAMYQQRPTGSVAARVYERFSEANISAAIAARDDLPLHLSIDFNINPGMHGCLGQHDMEADLLTVFEVIHGPRMSVRELMNRLGAWVEARGGFRWPRLEVFGDAAGQQAWAGTSQNCYDIVRAFLDRTGWPNRLRLPSKNPPVLDRVLAFNEALCDMDGRVHYRVHPQCKPLIADLRGLQSDDRGLPDKRDRDRSHASDAEGYRVWMLRPIRRREPQVLPVAYG